MTATDKALPIKLLLLWVIGFVLACMGLYMVENQVSLTPEDAAAFRALKTSNK